MWSAWFSSPKILIVIFRRPYIASWCLVKDVSFIHLFVKYACLRTASVEKSSCFFYLCLQPKQKIEPFFSLPIRTDHILPVLKHIVSLPDKGKTELFKMCILTVPGYLSSRFGRSSGGGGEGVFAVFLFNSYPVLYSSMWLPPPRLLQTNFHYQIPDLTL